MANLASVTGVADVLSNLRKKAKAYDVGVGRGLVKAGLLLQRRAMQLVPVDTGVLKASGEGFPHVKGEGSATVVTCGFNASYAVYVHEDLDALHGAAYNAAHADKIEKGLKGYKNKGPNQQAKFLETPLRQGMREFQAIINEEARRSAA